ncbi:hypothetical protein PMAYCL1PPCAC_08113 [Pristionchus mayeri]|uniref:Fucosyltransferase n=1 Tax=Pristionchus mayeri TaxID=1317129 RepID=A0AAN4ZG58_9BILA|nr:hypothetical protein PMAYCL1PPCAC_08113 [Pristionchus mayeri]
MQEAQSGLIPKFAENFFNATVDYRINNFTYFDHSIIRPAISKDDKKRMRTLSEKDFDDPIKRKTDAVLAVISNCHAESGRLEYMRELDRFLNVTKVGGCFRNRRSSEEVEAMIKSHYFVVAFENVECAGYATEKFWRLTKGIVPIVLRRRILKGLAPPGSFVAADDYRSPRELARHLLATIESREEYRKYGYHIPASHYFFHL